jgi:hypothetical protein
MSKKTTLLIEASAELFFATYFMLAFFATSAQHYLFSPGKGPIPILMGVWPVLTIGCFVLYARTRSKLRQLEEEQKKAEIKKANTPPEPSEVKPSLTSPLQ